MTDTSSTTTNEVSNTPTVTVRHAVSTAAKAQFPTLLATVLIVIAYVAGMHTCRYCDLLHEPPTRQHIVAP